MGLGGCTDRASSSASPSGWTHRHRIYIALESDLIPIAKVGAPLSFELPPTVATAFVWGHKHAFRVKGHDEIAGPSIWAREQDQRPLDKRLRRAELTAIFPADGRCTGPCSIASYCASRNEKAPVEAGAFRQFNPGKLVLGHDRATELVIYATASNAAAGVEGVSCEFDSVGGVTLIAADRVAT